MNKSVSIERVTSQDEKYERLKEGKCAVVRSATKGDTLKSSLNFSNTFSYTNADILNLKMSASFRELLAKNTPE